MEKFARDAGLRYFPWRRKPTPLRNNFICLAIPCKISREGEKDFPRYRGRRGYVVGESRDHRCWKVRFADQKHPVILHKSFIRPSAPVFQNGILQLHPQQARPMRSR